MITVMELQLIFFLLSFLHGIYGQVTVPPSTAVARGEDVSLECTTAEANPTFTWSYATNGQPLYTGTTRSTNADRYANIVLQEGTAAQTSILNINVIELEDEGAYLCSTTNEQNTPSTTVVTVEVASASQEIDLFNGDNFANYQATCDAIGSKPEETITWVLDGITQTVGIVETDPDISADPLFDKRSVFTFPASLDNYNVTLVCQIGGHQVPGLGRNESRFVDVQSKPTTNIRVEFQSPDASLTVSCVIDDPTQPIPSIINYYIYSNDTLILQSSMGDNDVDVPDTEFDLYTVFTCVAGNYLGNVTSQPRSYDPDSTTTPPPTTAPEGTTSGDTVGSGGTGTGPPGPNTAAIAGGVVGGIACIVIIVIAVLYCKKQESCCFEAAGSKSSGSSKKPAGSAVGSSNGSEKDKINKPEAAPRGQGSIQHTANNPGQELYALPERKQPAGGRGGDAPDRGSGPGQNEPQGMLYADLDLSSKAGHTEKHVPKNENDVVVYSSILV